MTFAEGWSPMARRFPCGAPCPGSMTQARPGAFFQCIVCGRRTHTALCVDEEGRVECGCGLNDARDEFLAHEHGRIAPGEFDGEAL